MMIVVVFSALIGCFLLTNGGVRANTVDDVTAEMRSVNATNCHGQRVYLDYDDVSSVPRFRYPHFVQPKNRSSLQYAYNVAANRAMFFSMIYAWQDTFSDFGAQPGVNYLYMSEAANVLAGPDSVLGSGLFFLPNRSYPNWLPTVGFNSTLPLFAVRATRDQGGRLAHVKDLGNTPETNYTNQTAYPQNEFFRSVNYDVDWSHNYVTYRIQRVNGNGTSSPMTFKAARPLGLDYHNYKELSRILPPYYDCGQTDRWLVPEVAYAVDFLARYSHWTHLRHMQPVAASTVDVLYESVDVNPCPLSINNEPPNSFAGTAYCPAGGQCQVVPGQGLSSSGYTCCWGPSCAPEPRISGEMFSRGYSILYTAVVSGCTSSPAVNVASQQLPAEFWDLDDIRTTFEVQGRTGLRLAHFLSNFLQNNDPADNARNVQYFQDLWNDFFASRPTYMTPFGPRRNMSINAEPQADSPMRYLTVDHALERKWIEAEVVSAVMADGEIMSAGIFLERGVFPASTTPVSAFAWEVPMYGARGDINGSVADLYQLGEDFTTQPFYTQARSQFNSSSSPGRTEFRTTATVRTGLRGQPRVQPVPGEVTYIASLYQDGQWLPPHFRCNAKVNHGWVVSYVAPIFAKSPSGTVVFGGVVKVDSYFTQNHFFART